MGVGLGRRGSGRAVWGGWFVAVCERGVVGVGGGGVSGVVGKGDGWFVLWWGV